jgi:hypothetical protein
VFGVDMIMKINEFIINILKSEGRKINWLYDQYIGYMISIGENYTGYKAFNRRLNEDKLTAIDLVIISHILSLDIYDLTKTILNLQ